MMSTPTMDKNQRRLMLLLPLFFVLFIISFPAGLILYWITTNAWTMGQQYVIRRRVGPLTPVTTAGPAAPPTRGAVRAARGEPNGSGAGDLARRLRGRGKNGGWQGRGRQEGGQAARQRGCHQPSEAQPQRAAAAIPT